MTILLVEDNFEHLRLTKYILQKNNVAADVRVVRDGQEAMDYLHQRNEFADSALHPRPDLVLLDFNIPRIDGKEVLRMMKDDAQLCEIPVVVVSSSSRQEDMSYAQEMGAAAYISKSAGFEQLSEQLAAIEKFARHRPSL